MDYKELEAALYTDEQKAAEYQRVLESAKENGAKSDVEAMSLAAAAIGYEFTPEQIEQHLASIAEVSEDELEVVAGGADFCYEGNVASKDENGNDTICFASYHCFTALLHPDDNSKRGACWSDYKCWMVYELD